MQGRMPEVSEPRGLTLMIAMAIMAADMENMMAGSSMTTAAPTLVWKNPTAASQPLQGAKESEHGCQHIHQTRSPVSSICKDHQQINKKKNKQLTGKWVIGMGTCRER